MNKILLLSITASVLLFSCTNNQFEEFDFELDTFEFKYDMDEYFNDVRLMNTHTLIKEENNTFSRVENEINYSFGIEFKGDKIISTSKTPYVFAKVRKDSIDINSNTALVASCTLNDSVIYWESVKIDSNFISAPNEWNGLNYSGFHFPEDVSSEARIAFYFWSVDGTRLDVDNFEVKF